MDEKFVAVGEVRGAEKRVREAVILIDAGDVPSERLIEGRCITKGRFHSFNRRGVPIKLLVERRSLLPQARRGKADGQDDE